MDIRSYGIIKNKDIDKFTEDVNKFVLLGWYPLGGLSYCEEIYMQAMALPWNEEDQA